MNASELDEEHGPSVILSVCIATFNRARFIGQTLDSIVGQLAPGVELLVLDGASPDDTESVIERYLNSDRPIRYFRESTNSGVDADYDKAVGYARGEYCWLMTDDDLLDSGAIERVLRALDHKPEVVIANARTMNADMSRVLRDRLLGIDEDCVFNDDTAGFFALAANYLSFIGGVIIQRSLWLQRKREPYYGSLFVHLGVLFQAPLRGRAEVLAMPLLSIRYGNAMWTSRGFEIWMFKWPDLIWGFTSIAESAKLRVTRREPWRDPRRLIFSRAIGSYSIGEYRKFIAGRASPALSVIARVIAFVPGHLANAMCGLYCLAVKPRIEATAYDLARSIYATWPSRLAARMQGLL